MQGVNFCAFTFGAVETGKTYTSGCNYHKTLISETMGFIPMSIFYIFEMIKELKEVASFKMKLSFLEIYNDDIKDLLNMKTYIKFYKYILLVIVRE